MVQSLNYHSVSSKMNVKIYLEFIEIVPEFFCQGDTWYHPELLSGQFLKKRFFQDWMVWSQKNLNKRISTNQMKNLGKLKMTTGKPNHLKVYLLLKLVTFDCHASFRGEYINLKNIKIQTLRVKDHNAKNNEFQILEPNWSLPRRRCHSKMTRNKPPQPPQRNSFVKTKQRASRYLRPSEKKCLENHTN